MKHKHLFSLLDTSFCIAKIAFRSDRPLDNPLQQARSMGRPQDNGYHYKVPKAWDVKADDFLVVEGQHSGLCIARVLSVDLTGAIDPDADFTYKWAVQKVDFTEHTALVNKEADFQARMLEVERTAQREEAAAKYRAHLPQDSEAMRIFNEAVAAIQAPVVVEHDIDAQDMDAAVAEAIVADREQATK